MKQGSLTVYNIFTLNVLKSTLYVTFNMHNSYTEVTISHTNVKKINNTYMAVIQPRPTHIFYQCAKFGDDRTSFNVTFDVCEVQLNSTQLNSTQLNSTQLF